VESVLACAAEPVALAALRVFLEKNSAMRQVRSMRCAGKGVKAILPQPDQGEEAATDLQDAGRRLDALLVSATMRAFPSCMRLLLENGADASLKAHSPHSGLLHVAVVRGALDCVNALLPYNPPLELDCDETSEPNTPLGLALYHHKVDIVKALIEAGANTNIVIDTYHECFEDLIEFAASDWGCTAVLETLFELGFTIDESRYSDANRDDHPLSRASEKDWSPDGADRVEAIRSWMARQNHA
jgi:ankyrin repeat protein